MSAHLPPVPEDNRSLKGTGETKHSEFRKAENPLSEADSPEKLGHQGNTVINTPFRAFQQAR